ncbi:hypothetical protein ACH36K_13020 [Clostridium sp. MB05]
MKKGFRTSMSKTLALLVALTCITSNVLTFAEPIKENNLSTVELNDDSRVNLVKDPGFEEDPNIDDYEIPNWITIGAVGDWNNFPHTGKIQCWVDPGDNNIIKQTIEAPYNGYYKGAVYAAAGGPNGKLALFNPEDGSIIKEVKIDSNSSYTRYEIEPIYMKKGDKIDIGLIGGSAWVNGDDFEFYYDRSKVENLLVNESFENLDGWALEDAEILNGKAILKDDTSKISQEIKVPNKGNYYLEMNIKALTNNVNVKIGDRTEILAASEEYKVVRISDIIQDKNSDLNIAIEGSAEIEDARFMYDIDKMNFLKPQVTNIQINGNNEVGAPLNVTYDFNDLDNHIEGATKFSWLMSDSKDGEYSEIAGEYGKTLVLKENLKNKYLKCKVIPVDEYGTLGDGVFSEAIGPIDVNIINNPSFENNGLGWRYYGANIRYNYSYDGGIRARIAKGDFNYITQETEIPETGFYDLSAFVNTEGEGAKLGIMTLSDELNDSEIICYSTVEKNTGYTKNELKNIRLEKGEKIKIFFQGTKTSLVSVDNVKLIRNREIETEKYSNIISFNLDGQEGNSIINKKDKTIKVVVPYGTDTSKVVLNSIQLSEESVSNLKNGQTLDLSAPLKVNVTNGNGSTDVWSVVCEVERKEAVVKSSNKFLEDSFNWSVDKTEQFVMTGKTGLVNRDENNNDGSGTAKYIPSYWAGYYDRTAFYGRDFVHQATGGQISGLKDENFSMFKTFAKNATESRKWYTFWAINFDGTPHTIDYKNDDLFVREVPAQFELVEKAYEQYLWTGDERYIFDDDLWNFYTKVLTDYISLHDDQNTNGIAEGYGGIFQGSCTYNERGKFPIEAADAIGSQYQATLAYAGMLSERGEDKEAKEWYDKAEALKKYFNEDWSVIDPNSPNENYATVLQKDGKKLNDFGKENSWFIPMKLLSEPGERNDKYLDFISEKLGDGIGSTENSPLNIEAYTYIPEAYFPYNRNEEAWKWMKYIMSVKDQAHERATQGTNGDYPEISFTFISHTVEGLMGIEPDAGAHKVVTAPHLPGEVEWVNLDNLQMGDHELSIAHNGLTMTTLTNKASESLNWEARFYGDYKYINVNGEQVKAEQKEVNGELVSYANVEVGANDTVSVEATNTVQEIVNKEELNKLITDAEALRSEDYTKESWNNFSEALASAKDIVSNKKATQIEVDEAAKNLDKAMKDLKLKDNTVVNIDKSNLKEIIKKAEELKASNYTEESWKVFNEALAYAKDVFAKVDVTQEEVDKAVNNLKDAMNKLENNESKDEDKLPNTGDAIGTTALLTLASSLMAAGYALKRKRD